MRRVVLDVHVRVLDLTWPASREQIRAAHRDQASAWHPDRFSSAGQKAKAEEKMKRINNAFEELTKLVSLGLGPLCGGCGELLDTGGACAPCGEQAEKEAARIAKLEAEVARLTREKAAAKAPVAAPRPTQPLATPPVPVFRVAGEWRSADGAEVWWFNGADPHYEFQIHIAVLRAIGMPSTLGNGQAVRSGRVLTIHGTIQRNPLFMEEFRVQLNWDGRMLSGLVRDGFVTRPMGIVPQF
jgi:hypothetical protein